MGFKERLKEARLLNNMTQEQVAEKIGVAKSTFTGYEKGNSEPSMYTISQIMKSLNIDANFLWQDDFDFPMQVSYDEMRYIEKYRNLDTHGKEMVDFTLQKEWERSTASTEPKVKVSSTTAEIIPMRFLSYYQRMASAGKGEFLFPDIPTEVIAVPDTPLSRRADFVIGVNGRSMEDTYFDGDKVLVEKAREVPIGKIGIFIRGTECFIKEAGQNRLISHNEDKEQYPDIVPDERGIDAIGIVLGKVGD